MNKERIAGCQFNLSVMSDDFADRILSALKEVDTSKVWKKIDDVSTCVRGKLQHVFDVVKAVYLHAAKTGSHTVMSGTFSIGCPGDSEGEAYMNASDERANEPVTSEILQTAGCKFALYPMNTEDYMKKIYEQIDLSKEQVRVSSSHYATRLDGEVNDIFQTIEAAFTRVQNVVSHTTMTFTISANSPSNQQ